MQINLLLVVDQDPQVRDLLSETFASHFDVLATPSLEEAVREASFQHPQCILLDSAMPDRGAYSLCKFLRSVKETQRIPIILMGTEPREVSWLGAREMGAFDYLEKPLSFPQVCEVVKRAIKLPCINQRRSKRLPLKLSLVVRGKDVYNRYFERPSVAKEVSRHGLLVQLPVHVPVGEEVELSRPDPNDPRGISMTTRARVVWSDGGLSGGAGWHGLEFMAPLPDWLPWR